MHPLLLAWVAGRRCCRSTETTAG